MATIISHFDPGQCSPSSSLPDRAHVVQFYTDDNSLVRSLANAFSKALKAGESVVGVMTPSHERGLLKRLAAQGIDTEEAVKKGRLILLDALKTLGTFMDPSGPNRRKFFLELERVLRKAEAAAEARHKRVVVFGEMVSILCGQGDPDGAIRLEQLWNELAKTHFFHLRCAYRAKWFKGKLRGEPYAAICAEHSIVIHA
ncbi:MAG TPA: MEDS domain-containing protein [Terriglobales bacterium]|nr:MEDS domain-containing protein [Terriglobales bacterium]